MIVPSWRVPTTNSLMSSLACTSSAVGTMPSHVSGLNGDRRSRSVMRDIGGIRRKRFLSLFHFTPMASQFILPSTTTPARTASRIAEASDEAIVESLRRLSESTPSPERPPKVGVSQSCYLLFFPAPSYPIGPPEK